jgi:hypothetical protein
MLRRPRMMEHAMSPRSLAAMIAALVASLAGCQSGPTKEQIEAAKNTIDCDRPGERVVIQFGDNEARLVTPGTSTVVLYQVPSRSTGFRFMNGGMELRGTRSDIELIREQAAAHFTCKPFELKKPE